jgi:hypothetical protein
MKKEGADKGNLEAPSFLIWLGSKFLQKRMAVQLVTEAPFF